MLLQINSMLESSSRPIPLAAQFHPNIWWYQWPVHTGTHQLFPSNTFCWWTLWEYFPCHHWFCCHCDTHIVPCDLLQHWSQLLQQNSKICAFFFDSLNSSKYQHSSDANSFNNLFGSFLGPSFIFASTCSISILAIVYSCLYSFTIADMTRWAFPVGQLVLSLCFFAIQLVPKQYVAEWQCKLYHCFLTLLYSIVLLLFFFIRQIEHHFFAFIESSAFNLGWKASRSPFITISTSNFIFTSSNCPPSSHWIWTGVQIAQIWDFNFLDSCTHSLCHLLNLVYLAITESPS